MYEQDQIFEEEIEPETSKSKVFILEIKLFFLKLRLFPALVLKFFKNSFFSLLKLWWVGGLVILISFLRYTETYKLIYYKVLINVGEYKRNRNNNIIEEYKLTNETINIKEECYKNQLVRSANNAQVDIGYCNNN